MDEAKEIAGALNPQEPKDTDVITLTRAELEKQKMSEADKRVEQALKSHDEKKQVEFEKRLEREKRDAARLASLSEEERHKEELAQKEREAESREKALTRRELLLDAIKIADDRELPVKFAEMLLSDTAEGTLKNIDLFEKEWKAELNKAIEARMRGKTPTAGKEPARAFDMNEMIRGQVRRK